MQISAPYRAATRSSERYTTRGVAMGVAMGVAIGEGAWIQHLVASPPASLPGDIGAAPAPEEGCKCQSLPPLPAPGTRKWLLPPSAITPQRSSLLAPSPRTLSPRCRDLSPRKEWGCWL